MCNRQGLIALLVTALALSCADDPYGGSDGATGETASPVLAEPPAPLAGASEPAPIDLTLDVVQRFAEAHRTLRAYGVPTADLAPPLDEAALPQEVRGAIRATGLSVDEFLAVNTSLLPAYFVARLREAGLPATERPAGVREAHVSFVEEHRHEIERLLDLDID
jgi:hypothetical protein